MKPISLLFISLLSLERISAATHLGCYSSIPSSYTDSTSYEYQSTSYCANLCSGYTYYALTQGNTCICGNDAPDSADTADTCTTACFGYGQETCGGSSAYDVYQLQDRSVSSTTKATTGTTTSKTGTSTTTTSTDASSNTPVTQTTVVTTQNTSTTTLYSSATSDSSNSTSTGASNKSIIGPAVGGAVGGVVGIGIIVLIVFLIKRRHDKNKRDAELADSAYFSALKRDNTFSSHADRPISNPFISKEELMVDQRLNPVMLNSRRRISEGSLADEADYSRKILRVANPDDD